jgi:hypothetical protein
MPEWESKEQKPPYAPPTTRTWGAPGGGERGGGGGALKSAAAHTHSLPSDAAGGRCCCADPPPSARPKNTAAAKPLPPHLVPQPAGPQVLLDHVGRAAELVAGVLVQVGGLADVVDLGGWGGGGEGGGTGVRGWDTLWSKSWSAPLWPPCATTSCARRGRGMLQAGGGGGPHLRRLLCKAQHVLGVDLHRVVAQLGLAHGLRGGGSGIWARGEGASRAWRGLLAVARRGGCCKPAPVARPPPRRRPTLRPRLPWGRYESRLTQCMLGGEVIAGLSNGQRRREAAGIAPAGGRAGPGPPRPPPCRLPPSPPRTSPCARPRGCATGRRRPRRASRTRPPPACQGSAWRRASRGRGSRRSRRCRSP